MKSTTFALASLVATAVAAGPHAHQHRHPARHQEKRGQEIVWVTDYDYVTEIVPVTETIWVSEGFVPPTSPSTSTTASASSSGIPAQFFQPVITSTAVYVAAPAPSSTYVAPPPAPTTEAPAPVPTTTQAYVAPPPPPPPPSSTYVAPPPAPTTEAPAPVPTTTQAAPVPEVTTSTSSGGVCSEGSPCSGDITYYEAGLGACGWVNDGSNENVIALPFELMGTQSNGNPYCGRMVAIKCTKTGKTTTAKVVDKCMGCVGYSIDLSNVAFGDLADFAVGRTTAEWWFTS